MHPAVSRLLRLPALVLLPGMAAVLSGQTYDVLIRNGRVIDGSNSPWRQADVGIRGDRIVAVGRLPAATAREVIDAAGRYVVPGFIDAHSHASPALTQSRTAPAEALLRQGITAVLINPDGGGPTDLGAQRRALEAAQPGVNVVQMIGHNAVRQAVLGSADRDPTPEELERMRALVRRGFEEGAFGLSAGPFYTPGAFSKTAEHVALARVAAEFDGFYTSHIRDEADYNVGVVAAVEEVIHVAREARLPGIVTHIKVLGPRVWGLSAEIIRRIDAARAAGVEVFADQYPYEASSTGLTAALVPPWALEGGVGKLQARLANPEMRARIRREMIDNLARRAGAANIMIRSHRADPSLEGRRLDAIARERLVEPVDAALALIGAGGASIVSFNMDERDLKAFMAQPWTMTSSDGELVALGEGVPHPRSYGPYPRKLRRYVLEEKVLPLEQAIHSMTGLPAAVFRVQDRGAIRPGAFADVVVFDLATIRDRATYEQPHQYAEGVSHVFVNGRAALASGNLTPVRAGRVLVRARP
ncbi:MAG: amidohydrolase family protein [Opitutaceae bacterium]|nr:amidohydrolase family protein [Opitutaceae bacterium]